MTYCLVTLQTRTYFALLGDTNGTSELPGQKGNFIQRSENDLRLEAATLCDAATSPTAQCCVLPNVNVVGLICKILFEF